MIDRILVLGGGSAGLLAAATCKVVLPEVQVTVLRSPEIGIIGVGEGTIPSVPPHLHGQMQIDVAEFYREVQPSWKLGIRYHWGPRPYFNYSFESQIVTKFQALPRPNGFYCHDDMEYAAVKSALMSHDRVFERGSGGVPQIDHHLAYHLENEKFVAFLEKYARRVGVEFHEGTVEAVGQSEIGIESLRLESGEELAADLFIDCSGFRSLLLGDALGEPYLDFKSSLFCDRAVVGGWARTNEPIKPYTTSETMNAGWSWQIEHQDRITRGYVYSSAFLDDAAAEQEFRQQNPKIEETRLIRFKTGRHRNAWVKNVVAVGNAAGFVEPLEATALGMICTASEGIARSLLECGRSPGPAMRDAYNRRFSQSWDQIRAFLAMHYKFNTRIDTPFWQACLNETDLAGGEEIIEYYRENGPSTIWGKSLIDPYDLFHHDGWLTLLVGMQVPHRAKYEPGETEWQTWRKIQQAIRRKAEAAMTCEEALKLIYSPAWNWNPAFYRGQ